MTHHVGYQSMTGSDTPARQAHMTLKSKVNLNKIMFKKKNLQKESGQFH